MRSRKSKKDIPYKKRTKRQTMIYKTLHRKLQIEQQKPEVFQILFFKYTNNSKIHTLHI
jgi:hypothetical protein